MSRALCSSARRRLPGGHGYRLDSTRVPNSRQRVPAHHQAQDPASVVRGQHLSGARRRSHGPRDATCGSRKCRGGVRRTPSPTEPRTVYHPQHRQPAEPNGTTAGGTDLHGHEQRRPELDRELYLGHRRRRPPGLVRPRQVPRRHPPDDRAAPAGRGAGGQQAGRARHEGAARPGRRRRRRNRPCGRRRDRPSTTPRSSPCATCAPAPAASSSRPTSRPTSTASRPTCRTSSRTSSSATRSRGCRRPTRWAR